MPTMTSTTSAQHIDGVANFDYFSFASLLGNPPTSTSATRLQLQQKSIYNYFDSATTLSNSSATTSTTRWRVDAYTQYDQCLLVRVPTDEALCPNFQYGQYLLIID